MTTFVHPRPFLFWRKALYDVAVLVAFGDVRPPEETADGKRADGDILTKLTPLGEPSLGEEESQALVSSGDLQEWATDEADAVSAAVGSDVELSRRTGR
jgi:hypothetical protein